MEENGETCSAKRSLSVDERAQLDDLCQRVRREINCLNETDRLARKRALERLKRETLDNRGVQLSVLRASFEGVFLKPLLRILADPVEKCRQLSIGLVSGFFSKLDTLGLRHTLPYIVPTLTSRLAVLEPVEPSEELRLLLVEFLSQLVIVCTKKKQSCPAGESETASVTPPASDGLLLFPYFDDLCNILRRTLVDPFPEVKKESCRCVCHVAIGLTQHFHLQAESLVAPLTQTMTHQHNRVRIEAVKALGVLVQHGPVKCIEQALSPLGQRSFDNAPSVRMAVVNVVGGWLRNYPERYSFHHRLIPLLLCGMTDEVTDIREKSTELLEKVGAQFYEENEDDLKDQVDFHLPGSVKGISGLSVGQQVLIQRNISKILSPLIRDMQDWTVAVRLKSVGVLSVLLSFAKDQATQQLHIILPALYRACSDDESAVIERAKECADELGRHVSADTFCSMILPAISTACGGRGSSAAVPVSTTYAVSTMVVLARFLRGCCSMQHRREAVQQQIKAIVNTLCLGEVLQTVEVQRCTAILAVVGQLLQAADQAVLSNCSLQLFSVLLTLRAACDAADMNQHVEKVLVALAERQGLSEVASLYEQHTTDILMQLQASQGLHLPNSSESHLLSTLLQSAGAVIGGHLPQVIDLLQRALHVDNSAETRLEFFALFGSLLLNSKQSVDATGHFSPYITPLVLETFVPNLVWKAGQTAGALRAAAISCLLALLHCSCVTPQHILDIRESLLPQVLSGLEDRNGTTRLAAVRVMKRMFDVAGQQMDGDVLHKLYPDLLKRMDDGSDEIRIVVTKAWASYFRCFPSTYDHHLYQAHLEATFKGLLIHLDDPSPSIQDAVLAVLKEASRIDAGTLQTQLERVAHQHRSSKYCDELKTHIAHLSKA